MLKNRTFLNDSILFDLSINSSSNKFQTYPLFHTNSPFLHMISNDSSECLLQNKSSNTDNLCINPFANQMQPSLQHPTATSHKGYMEKRQNNLHSYYRNASSSAISNYSLSNNDVSSCFYPQPRQEPNVNVDYLDDLKHVENNFHYSSGLTHDLPSATKRIQKLPTKEQEFNQTQFQANSIVSN